MSSIKTKPAKQVDPAFTRLADEMASIGCNYTGAQLADIEFCAAELVKRGYALQMRLLTLPFARHVLGGKEPASPEAFDPPMVTYQLWGPRYAKMGDHASPLCPSFATAAAIALYNICRLDWQDQVEAKTAARH